MKNIFGWMFKKKWWVLVVIVIALIVFQVMSKNKPVEARTVQPAMQPISETLQLSGLVDAEERATVPYGTGLISWVGAKEGQAVKKWQSLLKMDTRSLEKQFQQDMNNFNKQFRTHDQLLDDRKYYDSGTDVTTQLRRIFENANFDLQNTVLTVEIRDLAIKMSSLSSPIEGVVTRVDKPYAGVYSSVADVVQVVNPKTIYFSAIVDETEVGHVVEGQKVTVILDSFPEKTFTSTVQKVDFSPSTSRSGGVGYKIHIPLADGETLAKLRLGMNGTATIVLSEKQNALVIPANAVISRDGKMYVDVKNGKAVSRKEITTGLETDEQIEILTGLSQSDAVIVPKDN